MENKENGAQRKDSFFVGQNVENMNTGFSSPSGNINDTGLANAPVAAVSAGGGKKKIIFFVLVIFLALAGVAIFYFTTKASPQEVLKSSVVEMKKIKSSSYSGVFNFNLQASENKKNPSGYKSSGLSSNLDMKIGVEISGKQDIADEENPKGDLNLKIKSGFSSEGGSQDFSMDMDFLSLNKKKAYLKLNNYDLGVFGLMYGGILSPYKGNWYYIDTDNAAEMNPTASKEMLELNKKILEVYSRYEFINFKNDLGDEKIGDMAVYHYEVVLDRKAVVDFSLDVLKELEAISREKGNFDSESSESLEEAKGKITKAGGLLDEIINNVKAEVWIGKKDKIMHRMTLSGKFDDSFNKAFIEKANDVFNLGSNPVQDISINDDFSMDFSLTDVNEPVVVEEPADAVDFQEAITGMMGGAFGGPAAAPVDTDRDGLNDNMEKIYKTNPNKPDTDGDGFKDGDEVKNGFDPLSNVKGAKLKMGATGSF